MDQSLAVHNSRSQRDRWFINETIVAAQAAASAAAAGSSSSSSSSATSKKPSTPEPPTIPAVPRQKFLSVYPAVQHHRGKIQPLLCSLSPVLPIDEHLIECGLTLDFCGVLERLFDRRIVEESNGGGGRRSSRGMPIVEGLRDADR